MNRIISGILLTYFICFTATAGSHFAISNRFSLGTSNVLPDNMHRHVLPGIETDVRSGDVYIRVNSNQKETVVALYSCTGSFLLSRTVNTGKWVTLCPAHAISSSGVYLVKTQIGNQNMTRKFAIIGK